MAGVEINEKVAATYEANHPETIVLKEDIRNLSGQQILDAAGVERIDLVAGCPPCQGFSSLTSKYHKEDPRNNLVLEMARLITEVMPALVIMENVPGLAKKGAPLLNEFISRIQARGYAITQEVLQLADFGVPQSRRRLVVLAGRGFEISLPKPSHSRVPPPETSIRPWKTLRDVVEGMPEPVTFTTALKFGGPQKFNWHVVRDLKEISVKRFLATSPGGSRYELPTILRPPCHKKKRKGFQNVYGRIAWDQTPPTITGGCTTPCKGRFGHPSGPRTLSVREAALIQTFPKSYVLKTDHMDLVCDMIGNAFPPLAAEIAARHCLDALRSFRGVQNGNGK